MDDNQPPFLELDPPQRPGFMQFMTHPRFDYAASKIPEFIKAVKGEIETPPAYNRIDFIEYIVSDLLYTVVKHSTAIDSLHDEIYKIYDYLVAINEEQNLSKESKEKLAALSDKLCAVEGQVSLLGTQMPAFLASMVNTPVTTAQNILTTDLAASNMSSVTKILNVISSISRHPIVTGATTEIFRVLGYAALLLFALSLGGYSLVNKVTQKALPVPIPVVKPHK